LHRRLVRRGNAKFDTRKVHIKRVIAAHRGEPVGPSWSHHPRRVSAPKVPLSPDARDRPPALLIAGKRALVSVETEAEWVPGRVGVHPPVGVLA
jgi:hypothetical protein